MNEPPQAGRYRVIYADPPWRFATYSDKGKGRSAEAHYDCLSIADIKAFPVASWAAPDAVLLLWATGPLLAGALRLRALGCGRLSLIKVLLNARRTAIGASRRDRCRRGRPVFPRLSSRGG